MPRRPAPGANTDKPRPGSAAPTSQPIEERLRDLFDGMSMFFGCLTPDGKILDVNRAVLETTHLSREEIIGQSLEEADWWADSPETRQRVRAILERVARGETVREELSGRVLGGEMVTSVATFHPVRDAAGRVTQIVASALDVTERKRAEAALRASEERFRQVVERIQDVFWMVDVETRQILYVSPGYERIWGRSTDSLYQSPLTWLEAIHPDDRERVAQASETREIVGQYDEEYRVVRPDGSIRWIHDRGFPIRDATGKVNRVAGVAEDITGRRELEEQFRQSQKMEAIGQLAGGVAHDFNNILTAMMMQVDLAGACPALPSEAQELIGDLRISIDRASDLTRQLLAFSRQQIMQPCRLDLNRAVGDLAKMLRRILRDDIRFHLDLHTGPLYCQADRGMLDQVLLNLAVNARDAMPTGGQLVIETGAELVSEDDPRLPREIAAGRFVFLRVRDTGCGIPLENRSRIYDPFFSTKEPGKGTGLGLATVFGIVKQHRGWISVSSEMGQGSQFQIFLPADAAPPRTTAFPLATVPRAGEETILVVEDQPVVRKLTRTVLEKHGYHVLEASHGVEALQLWEARREEVQLVLTDIVMREGMGGGELAAALRERQPDVRVIFTSGYPEAIAGQQLDLREGENFLQKPYPLARVLEIIRRALDGRRRRS